MAAARGPAGSGAGDPSSRSGCGGQSNGERQSRRETRSCKRWEQGAPRRGSALPRLQRQGLPAQHVKINTRFGWDSRHADTTAELWVCLPFITFICQ